MQGQFFRLLLLYSVRRPLRIAQFNSGCQFRVYLFEIYRYFILLMLYIFFLYPCKIFPHCIWAVLLKYWIINKSYCYFYIKYFNKMIILWCLFACLFRPLSSNKTDRGARKYPLKWQWREWVEVNKISLIHPRKS